MSPTQTWTYRPQKRQDGSAFALTYSLRLRSSLIAGETYRSRVNFRRQAGPARSSQWGILWSPRVIGRGFRLKARMFRLATIPHPRRAQTPSRSLLLSVHAGRSRFRGALSTKALSLPPGALWLVLPLHDDRPRIAVPLTTAPERILEVDNSRWAASLSLLALRFRRLLLTRNTRSALEVASGRSRLPSRRPMQPGPDPWCRLVLAHLEHAAGRLDPSPYE